MATQNSKRPGFPAAAGKTYWQLWDEEDAAKAAQVGAQPSAIQKPVQPSAPVNVGGGNQSGPRSSMSPLASLPWDVLLNPQALARHEAALRLSVDQNTPTPTPSVVGPERALDFTDAHAKTAPGAQASSNVGGSSAPVAPPPDISGLATDGEHGGYYRKVIARTAAKYHVDPAAVQAIIYQESAGNPNEVYHNSNGTSDYGIMQVNTVNKDPGTYDWRDPAQNIDAGVAELAKHLSHYGGDYHKAFHAYNGWGAPSSSYADPVYRDYQRIKAGPKKVR